MRVLIMGAGLAGPCLAHGLRQQGHDVQLFERDSAIDARSQGYRIHINGDGDAALRKWLPAQAYEQAVATSCKPGGGVTITNPDFSFFHEIDLPPNAEGITVDRLTLRRIMLRDLMDFTRFGAGFSRYELSDDGTVLVHLTDGSTAEGDLLVATDGANSGVRRQLLPNFPVNVDDLQLIYGRTPLTERSRELTPVPALTGFLAVNGSDNRRLALAAQRFRRDPNDFGLPAAEDYVMWAVTAPASVYGPGLFDLGPEQLLELAANTLSDWHPSVSELIRLGDLRYLVPASIQISERPELWSPVPVTLVGDAAHPMAPAGVSAGAAIYEAGLLATHLSSEAPLFDAVRAYETEMLDYGFKAVSAATRIHVGDFSMGD